MPAVEKHCDVMVAVEKNYRALLQDQPQRIEKLEELRVDEERHGLAAVSMAVPLRAVAHCRAEAMLGRHQEAVKVGRCPVQPPERKQREAKIPRSYHWVDVRLVNWFPGHNEPVAAGLARAAATKER
eukprot:COSAG02_NODE_812_length_16908_cov_238.494319_7_plen_127_part_00